MKLHWQLMRGSEGLGEVSKFEAYPGAAAGH